ncbi:MAG TPA: hypothetical protein VJU87_10780 [Gemmatimonadaceae bacterium]|nr:hypothetical protein [Gemmatimonadaceae bacterium]
MVLATVGAVACSALPRRNSAEEAYRAFKKIAGATTIGVNRLSYDALLQDAAAQVLILRDLAISASDSATLRYYASALEAYKDADALWAEQIKDARYDWIPKGRIMLINPALATRYQLSITTEKMPYTGSEYQTVPSESIQDIWSVAEAVADSGNSALIPELRRAYR